MSAVVTPHFLIVLPDLVLAARLKNQVPNDREVTVGFAGSQEDGILALNEATHLDLCLFCLRYTDGDGSLFLASVEEKFPRARMVVVTDLPTEICAGFDPKWVVLRLPLDINHFTAICNETLSSMQGRQLANFQIGGRLRSDSWGDWYEAHDTALKREIDLGILHSWATPEQATQFCDAASLRAQAAHDHVQTVFYGGEHEGRIFVSHEKWEMPNLVALADAGQKIDVRIAARILHTVASVLTFWDQNKYPHPPLNATQVTLSPNGVVKVENTVDPAVPFKPLEVADMVGIANAVHALLPSLEQVPFRLRGLINKLRASEQVVFETSLGDIVVMLDSILAPLTVANFLSYVDRQAYDETVFHHVIADFVVQGGHFTRDMSKIPTDAPIINEAGNGLLNRRGTLAMAHGKEANSTTSQFIFNLVDNASLNPAPNKAGFAVFGTIVRGLEVLDKMAEVEVIHEGNYYSPVLPIILFRVRRKASITITEVIAEAQSLDMQHAINHKDASKPQGERTASGWLRAMTQTDKALASMSKAILTLSGSLKKMTDELSKKDD